MKDIEFTAEELGWIERMRSLLPACKRFYEWTRYPNAPVRSSALSGDRHDLIEPDVEAQYSLSIAAEHLLHGFETILHGEQISPTVHLTVGRTALLSAANAYWLLEPTQRIIRQERLIALKTQEIYEQKAAMRDFPEDLNSTESLEAYRRLLADKEESLWTAAAELGVGKQRFNQTSVIKNVANSLYSNDENAKLLQAQLILAWRDSSAAAHGYYHFALPRAYIQNSGVSQISLLSARIDLDHGPLFVGALMVANAAVRLYQLRAGLKLEDFLGTTASKPRAGCPASRRR